MSFVKCDQCGRFCGAGCRQFRRYDGQGIPVEDYLLCAKCDPADRYGNRYDEMRYCSFPDCGCDGARLCMAENGPHSGSLGLNIEHGAPGLKKWLEQTELHVQSAKK
jgi:hypothetical protein